MVFYRKYRPQKFNELFGQEEISKTLLLQLTSGKVSQGYLFWGPKGTGKTSTARILAKAVNCEVYKKDESRFGEPCNKCSNCISITDGSFIDLIEIDAASNRGIDEIRDLREKVKLAPAVGRYKIYIIDEVHMLTTEAFNALLKTLEEPPKHVIFILATTEYSKLPATITSRLMKFNFKRAGRQSVFEALSKIAKEEKIKIDKDAIFAICDVCEGSFRDAVSLLDQVSSSEAEIKKEDVLSVARLEGLDKSLGLIKLISEGNLKEAVYLVNEVGDKGLDVSNFVKQTVLILEKMLYIKIGIEADQLEGDSVDRKAVLALSEKFQLNEIQKLIGLLLTTEGEIGIYPIAHIPVVLAVCKYCEEFKGAEEPGPARRVKDTKDIEEEGETTVGSPPADKSDSYHEKVEEVGERRSAGGELLIGEVEKKWEEFLNRVRPVNAHVFALLKATKPAVMEKDAVTLEVFYRFHKDKLEEPKIIKMLDNQMEETLGKKVRLKFVLAKRESRPTAAVVKSDVVESRVHDLEELAQEIFAK